MVALKSVVIVFVLNVAVRQRVVYRERGRANKVGLDCLNDATMPRIYK